MYAIRSYYESIELISGDTTLSYTFYEILSQANSGLNPITNTIAYTNQTVSNDVVYVRVENANGCYRVVTLNLVVSTTLIRITSYNVCYTKLLRHNKSQRQ